MEELPFLDVVEAIVMAEYSMSSARHGGHMLTSYINSMTKLQDKETVLKRLADKKGSSINACFDGPEVENGHWDVATKLIEENKLFELYQLLGGKKQKPEEK